MADYWKSLPKKYCDFCKCWFADNKASVDFHERGLRHQGNVRRRLQDIQRKGAKQEKEDMKYNIEMMKIESSAMRAFQSDVSQNPELAKELSKNNPLFKKMAKTEMSSSSKMNSRFGEESSTEESTVLVRGRERALDTIAKKFERKSRWLERKTAEGQTYYWNKETLETKWTEPKSGFLSLEEQKYSSELDSFNNSSVPSGRYNPYSKWQSVSNKAFDDKMPDLQLPGQLLPQIVAPVVSEEQIKEVRHEFKEKTFDSLKNPLKSIIKSEEKICFKKRKTGSDSKRNVRQRTND